MAGLGLLGLIVILTAYLIIRVRPEFAAARKILSGSVTQLSPPDIKRASNHLERAGHVLHGPVAGILRVLPLERQNIDAVRNSIDRIVPVLDQARSLRERLDALEGGGLLTGRRISLANITSLQAPLRGAAAAVDSLVSTLQQERTGWLIPTIWDGLTDTLAKADDLRTATQKGSALVDIVPTLLGADGPRRYLVLLVNNAEVRPSGGIVSGIGLLKIDSGRLQLGPFHYYTDLATKPYRSVRVPPDFERRYGRFHSNTTRWVNVTMSPDTEEVAKVAARLYRVTAGQRTDGAIVIDPRGVAALLPHDTTVRVPGTHTEVTAANLTRYVYYKAYRQLGGHTSARHQALIGVGRAAFQHVARSGFGGESQLTAAAHALAGGHVRFISFTPSEETVLRRAGVTGAVRSAGGDRVFVTTTNFNGTKLDYWAHQDIAHSCDVLAEQPALCKTTIDLTNSVPQGLSRYVAGDRPYGEQRTLLEVYVPGDAVLQRVLLDGQPATFSQQPEHGLQALGVAVRLAPGGASRLVVDYALPEWRGGYRLEVTPQPLSHDAALHISLRFPLGWRVSGGTSPKEIRGDVYEKESRLSYPQTIEIRRPATRGISSLWQKIVDFLHRPIF